MCFCAECRGDEEPPPKPRPTKKKNDETENDRPKRREFKTIRERLEQCGKSCAIIRVQRVELSDGVVVDGRASFGGKVEIPFAEACDFLGVSRDDCWEVEVGTNEAAALEQWVYEGGNGEHQV